METPETYFSHEVRRQLPSHIKRIVLFGSRARGDYNEGSDYDFLVIVDKKDKQIVNIIRNIEVEILNKFDVLSGCLVYEEEEWEQRKGFPIGMNIMREGILI